MTLAISIIVVQFLLIAGLVIHLGKYRREEKERHERLRFEGFIADLSSDFVNISSDKIDWKINDALARIGAYLNVDRSFLFQFNREETVFHITHLWEAEGVEQDQMVRGAIVKDLFPWLSENLSRGKEIVVSDVGELPREEARREYIYCRRIGILSFLILPIQVVDVPLCAIGLDSMRSRRKWSSNLQARLRLVGETFANALGRKQADLDTRMHRQEMMHVSKIATLGELSAALAHELNQPLAAILSNTQAARNLFSGEPIDPVEVKEILDDIISDDRRAAGIIKRLRSLMTGKKPEFTSVDINEMLRRVVELVKGESYSGEIDIKVEPAGDLPFVRGDALLLEQVTLNLILNGVEAMGDCDQDSKRIRIMTSKHDEDSVRVSVQDQGAGIEKNRLADIFEAFFTTKSEGMGMGLSICRSIIESHDGRLWAENNPDRGATLSFTLPVRKE